MPYRRLFLIVSCIGVHTIDVFGVEIERLDHRQWLPSGWWVGFEFLHRLYPILVDRSPARALLIKRET